MDQNLLNEFKEFLKTYRDSWNSTDVSRIMAHTSETLKARWAAPEAAVSDWGYAEAESGWAEAYQAYRDQNPKWYFEDVLVEINAEQEGVAIFWCSMELDGKITGSKMLFVETFRKENGEWKKIREYVENGFTH